MRICLQPEEISAKSLRNILGMNNIPRVHTRAAYERELPRFQALNLKHVRFHDAALENPHHRLVDVSALFPLFHLDETKEENYFFAQTDDYMRTIENSDAEIDFRLGETIDHSEFYRLIGVPADIDKWARICRHIIGHYKNGEMNGMHLNITRVSVWEEPDNKKLLDGTVEQYAEMFCKVYRAIKKDFPDIQVGGPTCIARKIDFLDEFLTLCEAQGVKPDFVSGTYYHRSLELFHKFWGANRAVMEKHGMENAKYVLAEWHYGPRDWARAGYLDESGFFTSESAAYSVAALIEMMDIDQIDAVYYYSWACYYWAVHNGYEGSFSLLPVYYGLLFFQKLAAECKERIALTVEDAKEVTRVLAGKTEEGKIRLLIACHETQFDFLQVVCPGKNKAQLKRITRDYREELCTAGEELLGENGVFEVKHAGGNAVYLLEFEA